MQGVRGWPDLISRVFNIKLKMLMREIKDGIFRPYKGYVYVIEFQKRGLLYVYILVWLDKGLWYGVVERID